MKKKNQQNSHTKPIFLGRYIYFYPSAHQKTASKMPNQYYQVIPETITSMVSGLSLQKNPHYQAGDENYLACGASDRGFYALLRTQTTRGRDTHMTIEGGNLLILESAYPQNLINPTTGAWLPLHWAPQALGVWCRLRLLRKLSPSEALAVEYGVL